jgi:hypothetical protein
LVHAENERRVEEARRAEEERALEFLEELKADRHLLGQWLDDLTAGTRTVERLAEGTREAAQKLVHVPGGQGNRRASLEKRLDALVEDLLRRTQAMKRIEPHDHPDGDLLTIRSWDLADPSLVLPEEMPDWAARATASTRIAEEIDQLRMIRLKGFEDHNSAYDTAIKASRQAKRTADAAMALSARSFQRDRTRWSSLAARGAFATFAAFLGVAAVGSVVPPTAGPTIVSIAILVLTSLVAGWIAIRHGRRRGVVVAIGVGASLSLFMAAYLATNLLEQNSILIGAKPITSIGETALLSLTVGVAGGTLGVELNGIARVIAFVQLLLTVTAVAAALTWGWNNIVDRLDRDAGPPNVDT